VNHEAKSADVVHDGEGWSWDELVEGFEDEEEAPTEAHTIVLTV
jgi:hypothetical protein